MCKHNFPGKVCMPDPAHLTGLPVISLDSNNGDVCIGGPPGGFGHRGRLVLTNAVGKQTYEIDGEAGITSQSGDIVLLDAAGNERVRISGQTAEVIIKNPNGDKVIHLDGATGNITAEGTTTTQDLTVKGAAAIQDLSVKGTTTTKDLSVNGTAGIQDLTVNGATTTQDLTVNGAAAIQDLTVKGVTTIQDLKVNGATTNKVITVTDGAGKSTIELNGNTGVATSNKLKLYSTVPGNPTIQLDGDTGDIRLVSADCAEDFDILEIEEIEPGTVVVLGQEGKLRQSSEAYDKKVAGVISGAGGYRPGILLDQQIGSPSNRLPVALMGKVYCKVDANQAPIEIGDLLTTAPTPGYAMKASDPGKTPGAVIGKALRPLESGTGLIPILAALQ